MSSLRGSARLGSAWPGAAGQGKEARRRAKPQASANRGAAGPGKVWRGTAGHGAAGRGEARAVSSKGGLE
jgi:hypothetical protein